MSGDFDAAKCLTLVGASGIRTELLAFGATQAALQVPTASGVVNVIVGYPDARDRMNDAD